MLYVARALTRWRMVRAAWASPTHRLDVVALHAMAMMPQVIELDRMHRAQHEHAQRKHDPFSRGARQPERIVIRIVNLPQSGQEKHEGASERDDVDFAIRGDERCRQPWRRQKKLVRDLDRREVDEIPPFHLGERIAPRIAGHCKRSRYSNAPLQMTYPGIIGALVANCSSCGLAGSVPCS